ncbi:hypothetical protein BvCmsNSP038_05008 [Escherichia coli]|nr:hypothetical protein BvCmsNSP038_05008 [Escherichia coli]
MTDLGGKTSIFSHPVYLFLREFSLQDFRGGSFGDYGNDWQTLELVFTAGSATVTPKLNGVAGPAFQVIKDSLTLGLNALTLTDVTKNAAYGVEIESLMLEINAPAA